VFFRGHALPDHVGAPLAGEPGFLYARLFADAEGAVGVSPAKAVRVHSDTRLQGGEHDELHFYFLLPEAAPVDGVAWSVEATLWWRSALGSTADAQMIESAKREHSGH
jgi:hypothetical protein